MFHVGQKVVCVDATPSKQYHWIDHYLVKGQVYTIADYLVWRGKIGIKTEEVGPFQSEDWLFASRFRPVHTTDISIFEAMLVPTPKEKVEA